jgi:hypothetical protein
VLIDQLDDYLVEVTYNASFVRRKTATGLHAPTVMDAWRSGAEASWIFTKKPGTPVSPEWGLTVDLETGSVGVPEAVHAPMPITDGDGDFIRLRVLQPTRMAVPELSPYALLTDMHV